VTSKTSTDPLITYHSETAIILCNFSHLHDFLSGTSHALTTGKAKAEKVSKCLGDLMSRKWSVTILVMLMFLGMLFKVLKHNAPAINGIETSINAFGLELNPFITATTPVTANNVSPFHKSKVSHFVAQNQMNNAPGQKSFGAEPLKEKATAATEAKKKADAKKRAQARKKIQEQRRNAWNEYVKGLTAKNNEEQNNVVTITSPIEDRVAAGFKAATNEDVNAKDQETYNYWSNLLLSEPSLKHLSHFISEFQTGKVSEDVYFQIAQEMLNDPRQQISEQGLTAANASTSTKSFLLVTNFMEQVSGDHPVRVKANVELRDIYKNLSNLSAISGVLKQSSSNFALSLATQILVNMAQESLQTPENNNPDNGQVQSASYIASLEKFKSLLPLLEQLANNSADQITAELAQQAATEIQKYI
jgi:hypothetical protein